MSRKTAARYQQKQSIYQRQSYQMTWDLWRPAEKTHFPHSPRCASSLHCCEQTFQTQTCSTQVVNCKRLWDMRSKKSKRNYFSSIHSFSWVLHVFTINILKKSKLTLGAIRISNTVNQRVSRWNPWETAEATYWVQTRKEKYQVRKQKSNKGKIWGRDK